jgi:hypothetical protein
VYTLRMRLIACWYSDVSRAVVVVTAMKMK